MKATVNCDASWCPNTRAGGWAVWIAVDGGTKIKRSGVFHKKPKSASEAEFWAMLNGAWLAIEAGARFLLVQGDCQSALAQIEKLNCEAAILVEKCPDLRLKTKWVKAHRHTETARHWVNDWCDREAKKHMRKQRKQTPKALNR